MAVACAKIILLGEHVVVYGKPAIAIPIKELSTEAAIRSSDKNEFTVNLSLDGTQQKKLMHLISFIKIRLGIKDTLHISINSSVPIASGFGSSASLSVALLREFSKHFSLQLSTEKINNLAFECEKIFHGNPSGIDNTVIAYEKPVFFKEKTAEVIALKEPLHIIIASSGPKPSTKDVVLELKDRYVKNRETIGKIFSKIESITISGKVALSNGDLKKLGILMNRNQDCLRELNLSTDRLDDMCNAALNAGAFGAKLSGAGKGGNMIALCDENNLNKLREELMKQSTYVLEAIIC